MRKYKENKEKIRKRKEELRRRRLEGLKMSTLDMCSTLGKLEENIDASADGGKPSPAVPIQDYLISSDEEDAIEADCNSSLLLDKIVQGDKIVDELDVLTFNRVLKRPLPPHRSTFSMMSSTSTAASTSAAGGGAEKHEHKKRKLEKKEKR